MADESSRKLAVIMHADVVGSTELVRLNEIIADQRIQDAFQRFAGEIVSRNGIAHEVRGDALVAEFARASDAVSASLAFQSANALYNEDISDKIRPVLRVGIAMGEVFVTENRMTGEGVVLAQRLEQLAEPGGVCIQGAAYETVPGRLPFEFRDLGERTLKGFDKTVRAYSVKPASDDPTEPSDTVPQPELISLEVPDEPSIAVLPFTNMSVDPEQEFFCDGITEDIITALSRISGLLVIARNSTMVYKGKAVDVKQVGREQGVRYVLEGSVRKASDRIRVTAQLIDVATGSHRWADRYDRQLEDIFAVQDDITKHITVEMRVELTRAEYIRAWAKGTRSVAAWEKTVLGNQLQEDWNYDGLIEARRLAQEAIEIDPEYGMAWVLLGWSHLYEAYGGLASSREDSLGHSADAANEAVELDADNAQAYALLGQIQVMQGEQDVGVALLEKGERLSPNDAGLIATLADALSYVDRAEEAISKANRAMRLSPNHPAWYLKPLGVGHYMVSEYQLCIDTFRQLLRART